MPWYRNTKIAENTVEEAAQAYFDVLGSPPNAWGRNAHPVYGDSGTMLMMMNSVFGAEAFDTAFKDVCREDREARSGVNPAPVSPRM